MPSLQWRCYSVLEDHIGVDINIFSLIYEFGDFGLVMVIVVRVVHLLPFSSKAIE